MSQDQILLNFGFANGFLSLNKSRIPRFEKLADPDPDSKNLVQERSLEM